MRAKSCVILLLLAAIAAITAPALGAPSCTPWMKQNDGTEWRTCVGDDGRQYCEQKSKDGTISRVSCK